MDIFHLNWIAISAFVIVWLIILLISVRLYKHLSRWRSFISNIDVESINLDHLKSKILVLKEFSTIYLVKNNSIDPENITSLIILVGDYWFKKIHRVLIEALCSCGYCVIFLSLYPEIIYKIRKDQKKFYIKNGFISLLKYLKKKDDISYDSYTFIDYTMKRCYFQELIAESNKPIISINPKITKSYLNKLNNSISGKSENNYNIIFSQYSHLFFNNKYKKRINNNLSGRIKEQINIISIKKSRYSFRYYETIVFGEIIKLVT